MKTLAPALCLVAAVVVARPVAAGDLSLTIENGYVTLVADNVPLRQILSEWARVGQTRIVNGERVTGAPVTLRLEHVPERQAIETLLRGVSGYMIAPRQTVLATASLFDRILILPNALPPATAGAAAGQPGQAVQRAAAPPPVVQKPPQVEGRFEVAEDDDAGDQAEGAPTPPMPPGAMINPYTGKPAETNFDYANPPQLQPGAAPPPALFPGSVVPGAAQPQGTTPVPVTTTRPGEIVPAQPAQYQNPYAPPTQTPPPDRSKYLNPYQPQKPPGEQEY